MVNQRTLRVFISVFALFQAFLSTSAAQEEHGFKLFHPIVWRQTIVGSIVNATFQGLKVLTYIDSSAYCSRNTEIFSEHALDLYDSIGFEDYLSVTYNFTEAMGRTGKILRNCTKALQSVSNKAGEFSSLWNSAFGVYKMIRKNVVQNRTDIDERAWSAYNNATQNITQVFFDYGRLFYLYILQDLNNPTVNQQSPHSHIRSEQLNYDFEETVDYSQSPQYHQQQEPEVKVETSQVWQPIVGVFPPDPPTFGFFHMSFEYLYEFVKGSRLVDQQHLDPCEHIVSVFFEDMQSALAYFEYGTSISSLPAQVEGVYQVFDSFVSLTPIAQKCINTGQHMIYTGQTIVRGNFQQPTNILINFLFELFYIISDLFAQFANIFYEDWFSFSYHMGDLTYRFIVVYHDNPF